jgi:L-alanine-DL-glutamate epimerase-like enolase superfamily enzyme
MKITAITTEQFRWPRRNPIRNGMHTYTDVALGIVKIETDENITGIGLGGTGRVGQATIEELKHELIGEDPIDVERLWHKMWVPKIIGRRGLTTRAISAIDIGLWDIRAKVARLPLYKLLGGYRDRMPTYIAGGPTPTWQKPACAVPERRARGTTRRLLENEFEAIGRRPGIHVAKPVCAANPAFVATQG